MEITSILKPGGWQWWLQDFKLLWHFRNSCWLLCVSSHVHMCVTSVHVCVCLWVHMQAFFPIPLNFWNIFKGTALIEIPVKLETKHFMRNQKMGLWESSSQILSEKKEFTSLCGDDQGIRCLEEASVLFSPGNYHEQIPLLIWVEHITWVRGNSYLCWAVEI